MKKYIWFSLISLPLFAQLEIPAPPPELPPLRETELVKPPAPRAARKKTSQARPSFKEFDDEVAKVIPVKCKKPKGKFPWNFDKAKFSDVVDQVSSLTCKSFIYSAAVKPAQEVTILSKTEITVDQAWNVFLSLLETYELALVESGKFYKIVRRNDSIRQPIPVVDGINDLPANESMVTYLHDLKHVSKDIALNLAKGLISRLGDVSVVGENLMVMTDGSSNIRRIEKILQRIDVSSAANRVHVVDLVYAEAKAVTETLNKIFDSKSASVERSRYMSASERAAQIQSGKDEAGDGFSVQKIIPEDRTNKLIVIASDKGYERVKEMIDTLDVPSSKVSGQMQINVYYLKNGDATKIAATLSTLTQSLKNRSNQGSMVNPFGPGTETFEGDIKINADASTNSLIIVSNARDFKALSVVVAKLDKERIQVYVEAAIFDIGLQDDMNFGINAYGAIPDLLGAGNVGLLANPGGRDLVSGVVGAIGKAATTNPALAGGAALASFVNTVGFMGARSDLFGIGVKLPGIGVVLDTLQKYSNVDVLSTPSLMTLDNEKAEISVGEKIPLLKGVTSIGLGSSGIGGAPMQNVEMMDVKLKFGITPHVNNDNQVRLEIDQDVNELGQQVEILGSPQYNVRTKSAKTTVVAKDQQTIVIGGLIDQRQNTLETKIPILGDIPIIGYLFKKTTKTKVKRNLILVLTPYVIRSDADLDAIHRRKMKEREEFGKLYFGDKITKFDPAVDYDKKTGPVGRLIHQVDHELKRMENGGPGLPGETVVKSEDVAERKEKVLKAEPPSTETISEPPSVAPETIMPTVIDDGAAIPSEMLPIPSEPAPAPVGAP